MPQSDFLRSVSQAQKRLKQAGVELARTQALAEQHDMAGAFGAAFAFEAEVEKLALLARAYLLYTSRRRLQGFSSPGAGWWVLSCCYWYSMFGSCGHSIPPWASLWPMAAP